MDWSENKEYLQVEIGDLDGNGWNYRLVIDVFYLYLLAGIFGVSMGVFIIVISHKLANTISNKLVAKNSKNKKKKSLKQIEKISRGGDRTDLENIEIEEAADGMVKILEEIDLTNLSESERLLIEEIIKLVNHLANPSKATASKKLVSKWIRKLSKYFEFTDAVCFSKKGLYEIKNKQITRKIFDSLKSSIKKKALPIVVTVRTALVAKKVVDIQALELSISGVPVRLAGILLNLQGGVGVGSSLALIALKIMTVFRRGIMITGFSYFFFGFVKSLLLISNIGGIYSIAVKKITFKTIVLIAMVTVELSSRRFQNYYCDKFLTYSGDSSVEVVRLNPTTSFLPDSSQGIYVQVPSSSFKLFREDAPQCKLSIEDVSKTFHNFGVDKFNNYLEKQTEICKTQQILEGEPLSLENFDLGILKDNIGPKSWKMIQREVYREEKKLNQMLPDVPNSLVEVVKEFPKPTKSIVGQRNLTCEEIEFYKTSEGLTQIRLGDHEGPGTSKMPIEIQEKCLKVPLSQRTGYLRANRDPEKRPEMVESDKPKMVQEQKADRIRNSE